MKDETLLAIVIITGLFIGIILSPFVDTHCMGENTTVFTHTYIWQNRTEICEKYVGKYCNGLDIDCQLKEFKE